MRIAFITRSTLYKIYGGSGVQITETAKQLRKLGVEVTICMTHEKIDYSAFDLLHFFDITRPANILGHIKRSGKPFVVSTILVNYSEYDKQYRKGFAGTVFHFLPGNTNEYLKTVGRWISGKDGLQSKAYLWEGQTGSIKEILKKATLLLPNSQSEYDALEEKYAIERPHFIIPNGIDPAIFSPAPNDKKEENLVICAARVEGIKNQLNLVKALNNTRFKLVIIGDATPGQQNYYKACREIAGDNISFIKNLKQEELVDHYRQAKVHVLPSWFETCGLSSLEAAAMGCNIVISDRGFVRDYFGDHASYCEPGDPVSIYNAIEKAAGQTSQKKLQEKVLEQYTWEQAALHTLTAYKTILSCQ